MDLVKIALRVAAGDAQVSPDTAQSLKCQIAWFEGSSAADVAYTASRAAEAFPGPVWVDWFGFGWVAVSQDPATVSPETPVEDVDGAYPMDEGSTWKDYLKVAGANDASGQWRKWASFEEFTASDDSFVRFGCSHDPEEAPEFSEALRESGLDRAADAVDAAAEAGEIG